MKKDIDLLAGLNESNTKGNSQATSLLVIIMIIALVGIMAFLFVTAKNELKANQDMLADLNNKMAIEKDPAAMQQELAEIKAKFDTYSTAAIRKIYSGFSIDQQNKINNKLYEIIYTNYLNKVSVISGSKVIYDPVRITAIDATESGDITLACFANTDEEAWFFINYLNGVLAWTNYDGTPMVEPRLPIKPLPPIPTAIKPEPLPEGATDEQKEEYNKKLEEYNKALLEDEKAKEAYEADIVKYYQKMSYVRTYYLCRDEKAKLYDEENVYIEGSSNNILDNKKFISSVEYPGLPAPSDEKAYSITFSVKLHIDWRAVL